MFGGHPPMGVGGRTSKAAKAQGSGHRRCCGQLGGVSFFQNLRIQRSVGRAKDGTTFPLSLKLNSEPSSEEAADGEAAPDWGYSASIWVFSSISGLITLLPDGTIYGINHSFALMLFGYGKDELLGKVFLPRPALGKPVLACPRPVLLHPRAQLASSPRGNSGPEREASAHGPVPPPAPIYLDPTGNT